MHDSGLIELTSKFLTISAQLEELKRVVFGSKSERFVPSLEATNQPILKDLDTT